MIWRNTDRQYGAVAKGFHWTIAILIITLLTIGLIMVDMDKGPGQFALFRWHKSLGITVLTLAALRVLWRFSNIHPLKLPSHAAWEKFLAGVTHFLLYFCMFAMPLSGWLMSSAQGVSVSAWGLALPNLIGVNRPLGHLLTIFHIYTAYGLIGLICLHVAGALKHHVIDRDETLRRMLPFASIIAGLGLGILTLAMIGRMVMAAQTMPATAMAKRVAAAPANPAPAAPATSASAASAAVSAPAGVTEWIIDRDQSRLAFDGAQNGAPFEGIFTGFDGAIAFDPDHLAGSRVAITIPMTGVKTGSDERDQNIGGKDWFDVASFPESSYTADSFEKKSDGQYIAHGKLTLHGVTLPVDLPFMLTIESDAQGRKTAKMHGETTLKRLDFGVGAGQWADPNAVGTDVTVKVLLQAHSK
jgi:cytochrome b561/polyisoprenoid-binding protein YceI